MLGRNMLYWHICFGRRVGGIAIPSLSEHCKKCYTELVTRTTASTAQSARGHPQFRLCCYASCSVTLPLSGRSMSSSDMGISCIKACYIQASAVVLSRVHKCHTTGKVSRSLFGFKIPFETFRFYSQNLAFLSDERGLGAPDGVGCSDIRNADAWIQLSKIIQKGPIIRPYRSEHCKKISTALANEYSSGNKQHSFGMI